MTKIEKIQKERAKLEEIFKDVDPIKKELVSGMLDMASFLKVETEQLQEDMIETGMIKYHPMNKSIQKPLISARQYLQNANSYAVIIKTLNAILTKDANGEEDAFDTWIADKLGHKDK